MKKWIFILIAIVFTTVVYAQVSNKFGQLVTEREQAEKVIKARAILQSARADIIRWDSELTELANSGSFETVDPEIKQALIAGKKVINSAKIALTDPTTDICKILDWRP